MAPTFVISTGRCGSTLLSRMLRLHPEVLSLSELLSTVRNRGCLEGAPDGAEFWRMLSDPDPAVDIMVAEGLKVSEFIYPYGRGRYNSVDGVPAICTMTLPMLTDDPDGLHDELAAEISGWPARPIADQYRHLFTWLAARFDRPVVVERSGGSLGLLPRLREQFPEARFVYLTRDGADSALSMSHHPGFWLMLAGREAARIAGVATPEQLGPDQVRLIPPDLGRALTDPAALPGLLRRDVPVTAFGALWSAMTCEGADELLRLPADAWMMTSYEDLVADTPGELSRLAEFLDIPAKDTWLAAAAGLVDGGQHRGSSALDPRLLAALRRSCAPGAAIDAELAAAAAR
ncbi:sulfotransferase [Paractinoplanes hotanensis]|uniref:Sulfotransferase n=1 Tax=Paractinoplanes hotanensis TaxID=2906497 RepID=A0ABT0YDP4_9ACTN|nr:sulfotransferase [Actinoplanes hotanensis]MCM4084178.1 sulfotransferase [Actinoplanes hotanensis]